MPMNRARPASPAWGPPGSTGVPLSRKRPQSSRTVVASKVSFSRFCSVSALSSVISFRPCSLHRAANCSGVALSACSFSAGLFPNRSNNS